MPAADDTRLSATRRLQQRRSRPVSGGAARVLPWLATSTPCARDIPLAFVRCGDRSRPVRSCEASILDRRDSSRGAHFVWILRLGNRGTVTARKSCWWCTYVRIQRGLAQTMDEFAAGSLLLAFPLARALGAAPRGRSRLGRPVPARRTRGTRCSKAEWESKARAHPQRPHQGGQVDYDGRCIVIRGAASAEIPNPPQPIQDHQQREHATASSTRHRTPPTVPGDVLCRLRA